VAGEGERNKGVHRGRPIVWIASIIWHSFGMHNWGN
jgi:hypothetical protein